MKNVLLVLVAEGILRPLTGEATQEAAGAPTDVNIWEPTFNVISNFMPDLRDEILTPLVEFQKASPTKKPFVTANSTETPTERVETSEEIKA